MKIKNTRSALSIVFALLALSCAAPTSIPSNATSTSIEGRWTLDRQASDDVRARLLPLFENNEQRWRRSAERFDMPPPGVEAGAAQEEGMSNVRWLERERQKEVITMIAFISPATEIVFQRDGSDTRSLRLATNKGEGTRRITPGESSNLFLAVGGFAVKSMWEKGALVIDSRGTGENKMRIVERFTPRGDRLEEHLEVKIPGLGKHVFRATYKK